MIYEHLNYRHALKERLKELRLMGQSINLRSLAQQVGVQYTYLSKVLVANSTAHLNNDNVEACAMALGLTPEAADYLLLLKEWELCQLASRKKRLRARIDHARQAFAQDVPTVELSSGAVEREAKYLLDPCIFLVHMALDIEKFRRDPYRLETELAIPRSRLKEILKFLSDNHYIEWDKQFKKIQEVREIRRHFGTDHPMLKAHQARIRSLLDTLRENREDPRNRSFLVSFTADSEALSKIRNKLDKFIDDVRSLSSASKSENLHSLSLDLLRLF